MICKIRKRLARWKGKYISNVGGMTFIKSVLFAMFVDLLSLFKMPTVVRKEIVKIFFVGL